MKVVGSQKQTKECICLQKTKLRPETSCWQELQVPDVYGGLKVNNKNLHLILSQHNTHKLQHYRFYALLQAVTVSHFETQAARL